MAGSSFILVPSDKETGYLTENNYSNEDFTFSDDFQLAKPYGKYNVIYDGTVQSNYDYLNGSYLINGQLTAAEPSDGLDEVTVSSGLSNLGWSGDGTNQALLHLNLAGCGLVNISILDKYIHLQKVHIPHNNIEDLSPLGFMPFLLHLNASHNRVKVIGFLPPKNLRNVDLSFNEIDEIPDLSVLCFLQHLLLNNNNICEIKGLDSCFCLSELNLSHNNIKGIKGLTNLPIKVLSLGSNELNVIANLESLLRLQMINLSGNKILSLNGLQNHDFLEYIDLEQNEIIDVMEMDHLKYLGLLRSLNLQQNPIHDVPEYRLSIIFSIPQLSQLDNRQVTIKEKVDAENTFNPSMEYCGSRDHMMHTVYSFLQPTKMLEITLPLTDAPYPMIVLVGPNGIGKKSLAMKLAEEFPDYFGYAPSHTTRSPYSGETQSRYYHFVTNEEFQDLIKIGTFIQTYGYQGELYGLSMQAIEKVASQSLACVTHMELEGVMALKNGPMEPHYVLVVPERQDAFERRLLQKDIYNELQIATTIARVKVYKQFNRLHPGYFDVTISSDDIAETYKKLRTLVMQHLLLSGTSDSDKSDMSFMDNLSALDSRLTMLSLTGPKSYSAPTLKRSWSRPSLLGSARRRRSNMMSSSSVPLCSGRGIVEEDSLKRRHSAAKDAISGCFTPLYEQLSKRAATASAFVAVDVSPNPFRNILSPVMNKNMDVFIPNSPDSSDAASASDSNLSNLYKVRDGQSSKHSCDSDDRESSVHHVEPKRIAKDRNLQLSSAATSRSEQTLIPVGPRLSNKTESLTSGMLDSQPALTKDWKPDSEQLMVLPPIKLSG